MRSIWRISAASAAAAALCAGVFLTASSAQAATSYNIMITGSTIPDKARSLWVNPIFVGEGSSPSGCVSNIHPGQDRNTGLTVYPHANLTQVSFVPYSDDQCENSIGRERLLYLPSGLSTKNWWVSLTSYNIMLVGSKIPANVRSVLVDATSAGSGSSPSGCVTNIHPGRNTNAWQLVYRHFTFHEPVDTRVAFTLYSDGQCKNCISEERFLTLPSKLSTKNWWVSLNFDPAEK